MRARIIIAVRVLLWIALNGPRPVDRWVGRLMKIVAARRVARLQFGPAFVFYALLAHAQKDDAARRWFAPAVHGSLLHRLRFRIRSLAILPGIPYTATRLAAYVLAVGEADRVRPLLGQYASNSSDHQLRAAFELDFQQYGYEPARDCLAEALDRAMALVRSGSSAVPAHLSNDIFDVALYLVGVASRQADFQFAADVFRRLVAPHDVDKHRIARACLVEGDLEIARNDPLRAIALYRRALFHLDPPSRPRDETHTVLIGRAFSGMMYADLLRGDNRRFIEHCLLLIEGSPSQLTICRNLCFFLLCQGRHDELAVLQQRFRQLNNKFYGLIAQYFLNYASLWKHLVSEASQATAPLAPASRSRPVLLVLPAWGRAYVEHLLTIAIPTLRAPGNLIDFARGRALTVVIYTDTTGADTIRASDAFRRLSDDVSCEIVTLPESLFDTKFSIIWGWKISILALAHGMALNLAKARAAGVIFWAPDIVMSTGYFDALSSLIDGDHDIVFCTHLRLDGRSTIPILRSLHDRATDTLPIEMTTLNTLVRSQLVPPLREFLCDDGIWSLWPNFLMWKLPEDGFALHSFFHHPLYLSPDAARLFDGTPFFSNDSDLITRIAEGVPPARRKVMQGTEGAAACQLTQDEEPDGDLGYRFNPVGKLTLRQMAHFAHRQCALARWQLQWRVLAGTSDPGAAAALAPTIAPIIETITRAMTEIAATVGDHRYVPGLWLDTVPKVGL